jgi:hypothetical protein
MGGGWNIHDPATFPVPPLPKKEQAKKITLSESSQGILNAYGRELQRHYKGLDEHFSRAPDPRKRHDYSMEEILMGGLGMFFLKEGSRNAINNHRREEPFQEHFRQSFGLRLPHQDTIAEVLVELPWEELDQIKMDMNSQLFEQKWLRKYRLMDKYYPVAVDATGVMSFQERHCEHCLTKKSKNEKTTYFHYVLEAKLVTSAGHAISLATEWVENPSGDFDKQDCERKAFIRLAEKLNKQYPRLPICILADGLYPYDGAFDICEKYDWKYIFVLPDKSLKSVQEELGLTKIRKPIQTSYIVEEGWRKAGEYRSQCDIPYKKHSLNWFQCLETRIKDIEPEKRTEADTESSCFEYVTNITPQKNNIVHLTRAGRLRWKIENEGFNTQKRGGYELEHKYCRISYTGLKNYYTLLQMACLLNQLVEKGKFVSLLLGQHSKETICNLWDKLKAYMLCCMPAPPGERTLDAKELFPPHPD